MTDTPTPDLVERLRAIAIDECVHDDADVAAISAAVDRIEELERFQSEVIREYDQQVSVIFPSVEAAKEAQPFTPGEAQ